MIRTHCERPDRHEPGTTCGYPLPCPWHTVVVRLRRRGARRLMLNPPVYYRSERGNVPVRKDSAWLEAGASRDLSNTCWAGGVVDFAGSSPRVWVDDQQLARCPKGAPRAKRMLTYLLNADRWERVTGRFAPAGDRVPMVSVGARGVPAGYALAVKYEVPVVLVSQPEMLRNPRGWFAGWGFATGVRPVGTVRIVNTSKVVPIFEQIIIHDGTRRTRGDEADLA